MTDPLSIPAGYRAIELPGVYALLTDPSDQNNRMSEPVVMFACADCGALCCDRQAIGTHNRWHSKLAERIRGARMGI